MTTAPSVANVMRAKLNAAFSPLVLEIEDDSARHAGHAGAREGGETHFNVRIVSAEFSGMSRVERQRKVYAVLAEELSTRVHALRLDTRSPEEASARR
jgi:BolA protein